ncbi:NAD(P)-dependent oxidoreductase [Candidimonas nitroreducens]|uniref:3-hydroxyisobutyrate dehydrogenase n=1 Tax=Candidimonas nitroreducens TaxID=683354 RepID=A0A225M8F7_9BURK|nr:NAD(P)-dependent oxidoreductase [Candidimonas nitroreducens]OWT57558.1 3-hydroxyisobutyrate dehydrogenase [Candidimonas nitroreducens]
MDTAAGKPIKAGFIGLGNMGAAMSQNLIRAGFALWIHDIKRSSAQSLEKQGAVWVASPRELAGRVDVVFTCLPDFDAIRSVAIGGEGILAGIQPGTAYFDLSTSMPELVQELNTRFLQKGIHMLDAPVSGGAIGARRGRLSVWVGGDKPTYDKYVKVLRAMADKPVYVGSVGAGTVTKLVNNCAAQSTQAAIAEIFVLGVKAGVEPVALWEALRQGAAGRRRTFDGLIDEFLPGNFDPPKSTLRIVHKDLLSATNLARQLNVPTRFASLALADIQEAMLRGWADRDSRSVMLLPQERVGVSIRESKDALEDVLQRDPAAPSDSKRGTQ